MQFTYLALAATALAAFPVEDPENKHFLGLFEGDDSEDCGCEDDNYWSTLSEIPAPSTSEPANSTSPSTSALSTTPVTTTHAPTKEGEVTVTVESTTLLTITSCPGNDSCSALTSSALASSKNETIATPSHSQAASSETNVLTANSATGLVARSLAALVAVALI